MHGTPSVAAKPKALANGAASVYSLKGTGVP
jgi:hypothetical protein